MYETEADIVIECDLPGMDKDKIDISLSNDILTISGKREREERKEEEKEEYTYYRQSVSYGQFSQSVRLPENVDTSSIDATYEAGVLRIVVPKKEPEEKKIQIKVK
jgi:HSP20 family protein